MSSITGHSPKCKMVSSLDCPSAKSAERSMVGRVKVFRREESVGVGSADSLPIELNVGKFFDGELVERCISSVERKLLSDGEATSFGFDVIGAPFGGKFTLGGRGARGVIEGLNPPPPIADTLAESPGVS
eukprot:scaffold20991_cov127-Isochrysis_galbana.AAC.3